MHRQDPSLIFPMLVWDTFPRSGASQVADVDADAADADAADADADAPGC